MDRREEIRAYISREIAGDVDPDELPDDFDLIENGILQSLAMVRLISWLGETYDLPVNDIEIAPHDFTTVKRICEFVETHRASAA
jgi:acyl carrier protein